MASSCKCPLRPISIIVVLTCQPAIKKIQLSKGHVLVTELDKKKHNPIFQPEGFPIYALGQAEPTPATVPLTTDYNSATYLDIFWSDTEDDSSNWKSFQIGIQLAGFT